MTPEEIQKLSEDLVLLYTNMETDLLLNIANKLKVDKITIDNVEDWQLERLKQLNGLNAENIKVIADNSNKTKEEVTNILLKSATIGYNIDNDIIDKAVKNGILTSGLDESVIVKKILKTASKEVYTTLNQVNKSMIASAGKEYKNIINNITTGVLAGTKDINSSIKSGIQQLADNGLTGFRAKNGAMWSTEAYVNMITKTNISNISNASQDERIQSTGADYIEINSYVGARPLCALDQGDIFSLSNNTKPIKDINGKTIKPRAWSSSTYGKPAGIFGINCGHSKFIFVPELSAYNQEVINSKENSKQYELSQQQRAYERQIRNAKREKQMLEKANADKELIKEANKKILEKQKQTREFIKQNDLVRQPTKEFISKNIDNTKKIPNDIIKPKKEIKTEIKKYNKTQLNKMSLSKLKLETEKLATEYYKSGKSKISFGDTKIEDVAKKLTINANKTSLIKDYLAIQNKINK